MDFNAIRPDGPTIAIEHQATGETPVHVTPDGIQPADLTGALSRDQQHSRIQWFPYDAVRPREGGHYLITARSDSGLIVTTDDFFSYGWDDWSGDVIAWAKLPEPYEESE